MPGVGVGIRPRSSSSSRRAAAGSTLDIFLRENWMAENGLIRAIPGTSSPYSVGNGTFTRASAADWLNVGLDGLETQAGNNILRRGPVRGALFEQEVTAQPVNSALVGAVAGSPGTLPTGWGAFNPSGLTRTLSTGSTNGVNWVDINWSGTTTAAGSLIVTPGRTAALNGQTWTFSAFAQVITDDADVTSLGLEAVEENAGLGFLEISSTNFFSTRTSFARRSVTRALTNAATAFARVTIASNSISSGVAVNFTLRIGLPMINQGQLTSPILTTNSGAVTRAGDQLVVPVSVPETEWTIAGVATMPTTPDNSAETIFDLSTSFSNRFVLRRNGAFLFGRVVSEGNLMNGPSVASPSLGARFAFCLRRNGTQLSLSINGGAPVNATPTMPVGSMASLFVGHGQLGSSQWNSFIERMTVFPTAVSDATLQQYSTLATWSGPEIDLDFTENWASSRSGLLTIPGTTSPYPAISNGSFTRASVANWINVAGNGLETQAANNVLRRHGRGALVEEAVTAQPVNSLLAGAVAGTPGTLPTGWSAGQAGLTLEVVSVVGTKIRVRLFGTANASFCEIRPALTPVASVAQGQRWTGQVLAGLTVNSGTVPGVATIAVNEMDSAGVNLANSTSGGVSLTATPQRLSHSRTTTNASVSRVHTAIVIALTSGQTYDFTVEVEAFTTHQGELTSPILTTNSGTVTRAADALSVPVSGIAAGGDWTVVAVGRMPNSPPISTTMFNLGATSNDRFGILLSGGNFVIVNRNGGSVLDASMLAYPAAGTRFAVAVRKSSTSFGLSLNGGPVNTATPASITSIAPTTLSIGNNIFGAFQWNDYIERVMVFPFAVNDTTLKQYSSITTWDYPPLDIDFRETTLAVNGVQRTIPGTPSLYGSTNSTFSRASVADWLNTTSNVIATRASSGALRRDNIRGALIEDAVTAMPVNSALVGIVAGSPGALPTSMTTTSLLGITRTIGTETIGGIQYMTLRLQGTPSAPSNYFIDLGPIMGNSATTGQTWTASSFVRLAAGTTNGISSMSISVSARNAFGQPLSDPATLFTPSATATRVSRTATFSNASTANALAYVVIGLSGAPIDITISLGAWMLHQGQLTSPIITTNSGTVTRNRDEMAIPFVMGNTGSFVVIANESAETSFGRYLQLDDGTDPNRLVLSRGNNDGTLLISSTISDNSTGILSSSGPIGRKAIAASYGPNDLALSVNGSTVSTSNAHTVPAGLNTLRVGSRPSGDSLNGFIERVIVFPTRLSNETLQQYSSLSTWGGTEIDINLREGWYAENGVYRSIPGTPARYPATIGTFTRASAADWLNVGLDGLETQAGNNVLRRGPVRGGLFEQGVTAQPCNTAMAGGQVGALGSGGLSPTRMQLPNHLQGVTVEILSIIGNIMRVRCFGTTTAAWNPIFQWQNLASEVGAVQDNWWHTSVFARLVSGVWPVPGIRTSIGEMNGGVSLATLLGDGPVINAGAFADGVWRKLWTNGALQQVMVDRTRTLLWGNATTLVGVAVDFTIEFQLAMRHQTITGGIGSGLSPILTTDSGTVTRAADQLVVPVSVPETEWTIAGVATMPRTPNNENDTLLTLIMDANNRLTLRRNTTVGQTLLPTIISAGAGHSGTGVTAASLGSRFAFCLRRNGTQLSLSINGGAPVNSTPTMPLGAPTEMRVGNNVFGANQWNSFIERMTVFPTAVSDAEMQTYSTLSTWGG
jgi:hypothetical protein